MNLFKNWSNEELRDLSGALDMAAGKGAYHNKRIDKHLCFEALIRGLPLRYGILDAEVHPIQWLETMAAICDYDFQTLN